MDRHGAPGADTTPEVERSPSPLRGLAAWPAGAGRWAGRLWPRRLRTLFAPEAWIWAAIVAVAPPLACGLTLILAAVDPDYWWHLTTGRWILAHARVPVTDPFSWTHYSQNWVAHEWLAETLLALIVRLGGYAGALVFTIALSSAAYWYLLRGARRYGLSRRALALMVLLWGGMPLWALAVRPQVWGWALLCVLLAELMAYETGARRRLWLLPLLFVLWINLNLTALIGAGCLGLFAFDRLLHRRLDRHLLAVCLGCLAALLVNPRGLELLRLALGYARPNALRYTFIGEWQRPELHDPTLLPFWLATPLVPPAVWQILRRRALWPGALVLVFFVESLKAQRYTPIYGLVLVPFAGWWAWQRRSSATPPLGSLLPAWRTLLLPALATALVLVLATFNGLSEFRRTPDPRGYPAAAATALLRQDPHARLFNTYTWGGYLIYRLYPNNRVYVDGREEMYGDAFLRQFLDLAAGKPGWQSVFNHQGINAALVERDAGIAKQLKADANWRVAYEDSFGVLFVRR